MRQADSRLVIDWSQDENLIYCFVWDADLGLINDKDVYFEWTENELLICSIKLWKCLISWEKENVNLNQINAIFVNIFTITI